MRVALAVLVAFALVAPVGATAPATVPSTAAGGPSSLASTPGEPSSPASTPDGRIVAALPNPVADGDAGEYVLLSLPQRGNWSLSDGEDAFSLPRNATGRVLVTANPGAVPVRPPNASVVQVDLSLSNAGERLRLRRGNRTVDVLTYEDAPEGERLVPRDSGDAASHTRWRPVGFHPRDVASFGPANATTFVLPDSPGVPLSTVRNADRRLLLAGYTFGSDRVADVLVAAERRGVEVRILLEGAPVGGLSRHEATLLDRLVAAGVAVRVVAGPGARFSFHHPKYAVADDAALVMTENWKPAGTGGRSSRGWGVRVESAAVADELATVFETDAEPRDTVAWSRFRAGKFFERIPPSNGSYPTRFRPRPVRVAGVDVLTAPGNAESAVIDSIDGADDRVDVIQPTIGGRDTPFLRACLRAAKRGVEVRILLGSAWYDAEENRRLVGWLNDWADRTGAPLTARLVDPGGDFEKVHAKGLLVDDEVAVVGSLNWNRHSARENREVALALHGAEAVAAYRRVFRADWRGSGDGLPVGSLAGVVVAAVVAILVARREVTFD